MSLFEVCNFTIDAAVKNLSPSMFHYQNNDLCKWKKCKCIFTSIAGMRAVFQSKFALCCRQKSPQTRAALSAFQNISLNLIQGGSRWSSSTKGSIVPSYDAFFPIKYKYSVRISFGCTVFADSLVAHIQFAQLWNHTKWIVNSWFYLQSLF